MPNIFISSTFKDLNAERDFIKYEIGTELNKFTEKEYATTYDFIDLRLGIEDTPDFAETINACLYHLKKAAPLHPFIVIIGDKYGTTPSAEDISKAHNSVDDEDIKKCLKSANGKSVTNIEIEYGALGIGNPKQCDSFKKRTIFIFKTKNTDKNDPKLKTLKKVIEKNFENQIIYMDDYGKEPLKNQEFKDEIVAKLINILKNSDIKNLTPDEKERKIHEDYLVLKANGFIGREEIIKEIKTSINKNDGYTYIYGESGTGKSSIISKLAWDYTQENKVEVFTLFCGLTRNSDSTESIVLKITNHLAKLLQEKDVNFDNAPSFIENYNNICKLYNETKTTKPIIILIDAIDQLKPDQHKKESIFLSLEGYEKIRFVFSGTEPGDEIKKNYTKFRKLDNYQNFYFHKITGFKQNEIHDVFESIWSNELKQNSTPKELIENFQKYNISNPLYLKLIAIRLSTLSTEEMKELQKATDNGNRAGKFIELVETFISDSKNSLISLENLCIKLLEFLCGDNFNSQYEAMKAIAFSRHGLPKRILTQVLKEKYGKQFDIDNFEKNFAILRYKLKNILFEHSDNSIDFTHKIFRNALSIKHTNERDTNHKLVFNVLNHENLNYDFVKFEFVYYAFVTKEFKKLSEYISKNTVKNTDADEAIISKQEILNYSAKCLVDFSGYDMSNLYRYVDPTLLNFFLNKLFDEYSLSLKDVTNCHLMLGNCHWGLYLYLTMTNPLPSDLIKSGEIDEKVLERFSNYLDSVLLLIKLIEKYYTYLYTRRYQIDPISYDLQPTEDFWNNFKNSDNFKNFLLISKELSLNEQITNIMIKANKIDEYYKTPTKSLLEYRKIKSMDDFFTNSLQKSDYDIEKRILFYDENIETFIGSVFIDKLKTECNEILSFLTDYIDFYDYHNTSYSVIKKCLSALTEQEKKNKIGKKYICEKYLEIAEFIVKYYQKQKNENNNDVLNTIDKIDLFNNDFPSPFISNEMNDEHRQWAELSVKFYSIKYSRFSHHKKPNTTEYINKIEELAGILKDNEYNDLVIDMKELFLEVLNNLFNYLKTYKLEEEKDLLKKISNNLESQISFSTLITSLSAEEKNVLKETINSLIEYEKFYKKQLSCYYNSPKKIKGIDWNWERPCDFASNN